MGNFRNVKFDADLEKVLQLVSRSLYTNKDIFLRELISNASDACDKLRYELLINTTITSEDTSELKINIEFNETEKTLTLSDNGIGMNEQDLIENLGTIARSGTQKFAEALKASNTQETTELIGCFGVGFYSSFMVANKIEVYTKKAGESESWIWKSSGDGQFSIGKSEEDMPRGTKIILFMNEDGEKYLDKHKIKHIIDTYSKHISFPIEMVDSSGEVQRMNENPALWTKNPNDISSEEYGEFFKSISHVPGDPWLTLHNKNEGIVEYTNLLFIPKSKPFDLYHPDRRTAVKLYCNRVFITNDNMILTPAYLRFVHGVVDSPDLPLNISRETLQNSRAAAIIKKSITSKIISELKKKSENQPEEYKEFWNNFGSVLKEGLCDAMPTDQRENIMSVCKFYSSKLPNNELISLNDYIEKMKPEQEFIYYLNGNDLESMRKSPQLEGFVNKDIDVLLLTDHVDDFWTTVVTEYKDKAMKSVTRSDVDLSKFDSIDKNSGTDSNEKKETDQDKSALNNLVDYFISTLGDLVGSVRVSKKLTSSPTCLVVNEGAMDIRMERFLREQKQLQHKSPKILEINAQHKLIQKMVTMFEEDKDNPILNEIVHLLFGEACVLEGEEMQEPALFTNKINSILEKLIL